jgi:hypothetical protein
MRSISGHGKQPSMIFVFSTCKHDLSSKFLDLDIENPLGGGALAKLRSSLYIHVQGVFDPNKTKFDYPSLDGFKELKAEVWCVSREGQVKLLSLRVAYSAD